MITYQSLGPVDGFDQDEGASEGDEARYRERIRARVCARKSFALMASNNLHDFHLGSWV